MRRFGLSCGCLAAIVVLALAESASAENVIARIWHNFERDFARNNYWPEPFVFQDRDAVVRPFAVMIAKGWQVQNTLRAHHFETGSGELAPAGRLKVQRILSDPSPQRRSIFVERGASPEQTASRIATVQSAAGRWGPPSAEPQVFPTSIQARPWSASTIGTIYTDHQEGRKKPVLPGARKD